MSQNLFPILELEMTKDHLKLRLADDTASLEATLPKEMIESIVAKWQSFQNGTAKETVAFSRHYTGAWNERPELSSTAQKA